LRSVAGRRKARGGLANRVRAVAAQATGDFAEKVRRARTRIGLTQAEVAASAGLTQQYLSIIERGNVSPTLATAAAIAAALGIKLRDLL
jgi:DNA-binding XRE family transcriptional regulator